MLVEHGGNAACTAMIVVSPLSYRKEGSIRVVVRASTIVSAFVASLIAVVGQRSDLH